MIKRHPGASTNRTEMNVMESERGELRAFLPNTGNTPTCCLRHEICNNLLSKIVDPSVKCKGLDAGTCKDRLVIQTVAPVGRKSSKWGRTWGISSDSWTTEPPQDHRLSSIWTLKLLCHKKKLIIIIYTLFLDTTKIMITARLRSFFLRQHSTFYKIYRGGENWDVKC